MPKTKLTDEQIEALGVEARLLFHKASVQLAEQQAFLKRELAKADDLGDALRNRCIQEADQITLQVASASDNNVFNETQIQVCYSFPDTLHDVLTTKKDKLPKTLLHFMDGGIEVPNRPIAEDPMPQTGKTRAGARGA